MSAVRSGRREISVSNLDKVLFPGDGITKGDLIEYYTRIAPVMLPHLRKRPLTIERYPDGIAAQRVFQKSAPAYFPSWIERARMPKKGGVVEHPLANEQAALVYLANQATITHHVWLSTTDAPNLPDQLMFDLDPSTEDFDEVRKTALLLRDAVSDAGLVPFLKTSGSRGLHVVAPLRPSADFSTAYEFAHEIAEALVAERPDSLTLEFHKAKREHRIFLDINRNAYAQTAAAPFSVRARAGAPVAVPLDWSEVSTRSLRPDGFSMAEALARAGRSDPWKGFRRSAKRLPGRR